MLITLQEINSKVEIIPVYILKKKKNLVSLSCFTLKGKTPYTFITIQYSNEILYSRLQQSELYMNTMNIGIISEGLTFPLQLDVAMVLWVVGVQRISPPEVLVLGVFEDKRL